MSDALPTETRSLLERLRDGASTSAVCARRHDGDGNNVSEMFDAMARIFTEAGAEIEQLRGLLKLANQGHYQAIEIRTYLYRIGEEPT